MSSFGSTMRKRFEMLRKAGQDVPKIINEVAEGATIEAIRVATQNTPPNNAKISGTGTRSGQMAQHWTTDSITKPQNGRTVLANNLQYASYVNDGHRMDKHFVPGLMVDAGMLQKIPSGLKGGIMVGTKTTYVPGIHMKERAIGRYRQVCRIELDKRVKEAFK